MLRNELIKARFLIPFLLCCVFFSLFSCATYNEANSSPKSAPSDTAAIVRNNVIELNTLYQGEQYQLALDKVDQFLAENTRAPEYHLMKARLIAKVKIEQQALDYLTEMIRLQPDNFGLFAARGNLLFQQGYIESAKKDYSVAYENGYKTIDVVEVLFSIETENENFSLALELVNEAIEFDPGDSQLWFEKARLEIRLGNIGDAELSCYKAIQLKNDEIQYHQLYYEILVYQKKKEKAFQHIEHIYNTLPTDSWIALKYSSELVSNEKYIEAKAVLRKSIQLMPYESQLFFQLASIYFFEKRWEESIEYLTAGIKLDPEATQARIELAKVYFQLQQTEKALEQLNQARQNGARDPFVYETLARYYNQKNDTFEAERIIFEGLEVNAENYNLIIEYARILEKRSDYKEAIKAYEQVSKAHPYEASILGKLGNLYRLTGNYENSERYFKQAIELKPDLTWIRSYYTELLVDMEKWDLALAEVKEIISISPDDYWALAEKAQIEYKLGDYQSAFMSISQSIALRPEITQLKRVKGEILESLNRFGDAEFAFKEVLADIPDNAYILTKLAYIQARLGKPEALLTIRTAIEKDDFDISAIELFLHLTNQANSIWGFEEGGREEMIYELVMLKKLTEARRTIAGLDPLDYRDLPFLDLLAKSLNEDKIYRDDLQALTRIKGLSYWNYFHMGMIALTLDDHEAAEAFFKRGLALDPENIWIKAKLAFVYQQLEEYALAVDLLEEYLARTPFKESIWARLRLALNCDLSKQYQKAENVYLRILEINPNESLALNNLAWMYLTTTDPEMKKKDDALALAQKAVELSSTPANLDTLAEAYYQTNDYQKALKTIERALDKDKNDLDDFKKTKKKILKALESTQP